MNTLKLTTLAALLGLTSSANAKTMIDYFKPIPIRGTMTTSGWGIGTSGPRDPDNGLEDIANWIYWDGKVLKADDGKYHLFCSKWQASKGIAAWMSDSVSVHAVSDHVLGPYMTASVTGKPRGLQWILLQTPFDTKTVLSITGATWNAPTSSWRTGTLRTSRSP